MEGATREPRAHLCPCILADRGMGVRGELLLSVSVSCDEGLTGKWMILKPNREAAAHAPSWAPQFSLTIKCPVPQQLLHGFMLYSPLYIHFFLASHKGCFL
ncbi:hypothetical protein DUNSADRAFT_1598 [Dunaliella salina]|uniref:Encoded protein n=1 Tax=Dunaliella salina TaxID=3046 RepID=A0ABQ7H8I7_DUNSA|nr:hypothetical protein DUNSADRAFT_1598 [Dunaliella salina]|eukprot:KAF5843171.1 hypothetical protein DUNSADRAFT_1598 [Dunaliella salina]